MREAADDLTWESLASNDDNGFCVGLGSFNGMAVSAEPLAPVLVIGPPQSRKTSGIVTPAVQRWAGPAVVITGSAESVEQSIEARTRMGKVWALDPYNILPPWSVKAGWSPLDEIETWNDAQKLATRLVEAKVSGLQDVDFWRTAASQMLAPHLYAAARKGYTIRDVIRWIRTQEEFEVRALLQAVHEEDPITAVEAGWQREERARSSIYTTIEVYLRAWTDESVALSSGIDNRFKSANFLDGNSNTIYVVLPALENANLAAFSSAIIQHLVEVITSRNRGFVSHLLQSDGIIVALEESPTKTTPVLIAIDDAGILAPMASLSSLTSAAVRHAIQLITVFSDVSEIQTIFGDKAANSYINKHMAIVLTPGTRDPQTLDHVNRLQIGSRVADGTAGGRAAEPPTELNQLPRGSALCFYATLPPTTVTLQSASGRDR